LNSPVSFVIREPGEADKHGVRASVEILPGGTVFLVPATLNLEFRSEDIPLGSAVEEMRLHRWNPDVLAWETLETPQTMIQIDTDRWTISAAIDHLSVYGVLPLESKIDDWQLY